MSKIEWDELLIPAEPQGNVEPWTEQEEACKKAGGHYYLLSINEGHPSIVCETCGHDPVDGYIESIQLEGIPVKVDIEVVHYPANPNHADEYDVFYETTLDPMRM